MLVHFLEISFKRHYGWFVSLSGDSLNLTLHGHDGSWRCELFVSRVGWGSNSRRFTYSRIKKDDFTSAENGPGIEHP